MCYEIREVGIRSPDGLVVGSCTSSPGVLGSIPKREEPGKTGAPIAADGEWASDPFRIHTTSHAHTARSRIRAGPIVRATFWSSKLSTPRSRRHWFCVVAILCSRSLTQAGPWIIATQPALNSLPRRDLGFYLYVAAIARPPPSPACAPCSHPQTGPPDSATSPVIVLY